MNNIYQDQSIIIILYQLVHTIYTVDFYFPLLLIPTSLLKCLWKRLKFIFE